MKRKPTADDVRKVALAAVTSALADGKQEARSKPGLTGMRAVATGAVLYTAGRAAVGGSRFVRERLGAESNGRDDLRDEIEAEIEAAAAEEDEVVEAEAVETEEDEDESTEQGEEEGTASAAGRRRRRRRGRRGGRGRRKELEATFDHGEDEGYGLWLDASVKDNPVYAEHWAGKRDVTVRIEADQIVIRRAGAPEASEPPEQGDSDSDDE